MNFQEKIYVVRKIYSTPIRSSKIEKFYHFLLLRNFRNLQKRFFNFVFIFRDNFEIIAIIIWNYFDKILRIVIQSWPKTLTLILETERVWKKISVILFSVICQSFRVPKPLNNQSDVLKFLWRHDFFQDLKWFLTSDWCIKIILLFRDFFILYY